jgi:hypothetical protein
MCFSKDSGMMKAPSSPPGSSTKSLWGWFIIAAAIVSSIQAIGVWGHGGGKWSWLLHVSPSHPLRPRIESELGPVAVEHGHDGQFFYAIARDPLGRRGTPELLRQDYPWYRYRRILYPLLAGGFGFFGPKATLYGLVVWSWIGSAFMGAAIADLCCQWRLDRWTLVLSLFNLGVFESAGLLTSDVLAIGLALTGLTLWIRRCELTSIIFLALAALTRETFLLFAWSIALVAWQESGRGRALAVAILPALPVLAWSAMTWMLLPETASAIHNLSFPLQGIVASAPGWWTSQDSIGQTAAAAFGIGMITAALALAPICRNTYLSWGMLIWALLGMLSSQWVWMFPVNAIRAMAPLWTFLVLTIGMLRSDRTSRGVIPLNHGS